MATIRDVAQRAGVSTATVSRALNAHPGIAEATREQVLAAVLELGYRPNGVARSLRAVRTRTIGLVLSNVANPFFAEVARAAEHAAAERGLSVILGNADEDTEREARYLDVMLDKRVDGLLLSPTGGNSRAVEEVLRRNVPLVFVDRTIPEYNVPSVSTEPYSGIGALVEHLAEQGHRSAAILSGSQETVPGRQRVEAFLHACAQHGISIAPEHVLNGGFKPEQGSRATTDLLALDRALPSVLFVSNNLMTLGVLQTLRARGLRVPDDIAIASYDDSPWFELLDPTITAIQQPVRELGQVAVDLIAAVIAGERPKPVLLHSHLVIRESSTNAGGRR